MSAQVEGTSIRILLHGVRNDLWEMQNTIQATVGDFDVEWCHDNTLQIRLHATAIPRDRCKMLKTRLNKHVNKRSFSQAKFDMPFDDGVCDPMRFQSPFCGDVPPSAVEVKR